VTIITQGYGSKQRIVMQGYGTEEQIEPVPIPLPQLGGGGSPLRVVGVMPITGSVLVHVATSIPAFGVLLRSIQQSVDMRGILMRQFSVRASLRLVNTNYIKWVLETLDALGDDEK